MNKSTVALYFGMLVCLIKQIFSRIRKRAPYSAVKLYKSTAALQNKLWSCLKVLRRSPILLRGKNLPLGVAPGFSCPHVFVCQEAWWRWGALLRTFAQILPSFASARSMKNVESRKWGQKDKHQLTAKGESHWVHCSAKVGGS